MLQSVQGAPAERREATEQRVEDNAWRPDVHLETVPTTSTNESMNLEAGHSIECKLTPVTR